MSVEYQPHFIVIASHVAEQVKQGLCKIVACLNYLVLGIALTRVMPSIIITLFFGEVSFIPAKPSLITSGACAISDASISWPFSLLEATLADVSMPGVCVTSCSLLTKSWIWWSIFALS